MRPDERELLALSLVPGIGPRLSRSLLERFGDAGKVFLASATELETVPHIGAATAQQLFQAFQVNRVDQEIAEMDRCGVSLLTSSDPQYPTRLKSIVDFPLLLYMRGNILPADGRAVAIVGSRQCTPYGRKSTERIATGLVQAGYTIISGLARGIDGCAHQAALAAGGRTIAVLAGGLSKIYPPEHQELANQVAGSGALVSETAMKLDPQRGMFHNRNRLISGLAQAVVIIEANDKSGALITARHAAEQDRPVLVLPANADSPSSYGSLRLIRDGARLVRNVDDILEDLKELRTSAPDLFSAIPLDETDESKAAEVSIAIERPTQLDAESMKLWEYLSEPRHVDEIAGHLSKPISTLSTLLMSLEIRRIIQRLPGNLYSRR
jgi:DNA processing protein